MSDLLCKLRELEKLKPGDPMPAWLQGMNWGTPISQLAGEAADEIERLKRTSGET